MVSVDRTAMVDQSGLRFSGLVTNSGTPDGFLADYLRGITVELPPDEESVSPQRWLVPPDPFALGGHIVLEDRALQGWVTVRGGQIADVSGRKPSDVRLVQTEGVILPGLLDMHNHPDYNVFAPWEPPETYANRYRWRDSPEYEVLVKAPSRLMKEQLLISGVLAAALGEDVGVIVGAADVA